MSDISMETIKARVEGNGSIKIWMDKDDLQTINIAVRHPILSEIVAKMADGHAPYESYSPIYRPILNKIPNHADRVFTKPAISKICKSFVAGPDFAWDHPRAVLLYNAEALLTGYTLKYKVDAPFDPAQARRFGEEFVAGCNSILANARAFDMTWIMKEKSAISEAEKDLK